MAKKNRKPAYLFVLTLVLLYIVTYTIPGVTGILKGTEILEPGSIRVSEDLTCYFFRHEDVYTASAAGDVKYLVKEGTHVRKGKKVAHLKAEMTSKKMNGKNQSDYKKIMDQLGGNVIVTDKCLAQTSGIFSTYVDGYEAYFTPKNMEKFKQEDMKGLRIKSVDVQGSEAIKNEPLFKISDNDDWYIIFWVEGGSIENYVEGKLVTVKLSEGEVQARVDHVNSEGEDSWKVVLQSNRYYKAFSKSRIEDAEVISKDSNGLIVSNKSLTSIEGQAGVKVRQKDGTYKFVPVKVIASDGKKSVLQDVNFVDEKGETINTVNVYDEVLKNPKERHPKEKE